MSSRRRTPMGIQVICALGLLDAGTTLLRSIWVILVSLITGSPIGGVVSVLVPTALALAQLVVVWGLWELEEWAWSWALAVIGVSAVIDLITLLTGRGGPVGLVISGGVVLYLLTQRELYRDSVEG